jgi:TatD DNase family protein
VEREMSSKQKVGEICFFDTHAHLQWSDFDDDRDVVIGHAREAGVNSIVNIGFDIVSSLAGIKLTEEHEGLYATVGIHPHNADKFNKHALDELRCLCKSPKVVAVGEIGLDYYRNLSSQTDQKRAFEAQLALAEDLKLPVIIHDRNAHSDVLSILSRYRRRIAGIMHCFSGDKQMAEECVSLNFLLSFTGAVTFPKSYELVEIAKWADLNKIVLETDCPWLAPQEVRGKRNEPAFLVHTARKIAELRDIPMSELAEATTSNAKKAFQIA